MINHMLKSYFFLMWRITATHIVCVNHNTKGSFSPKVTTSIMQDVKRDALLCRACTYFFKGRKRHGKSFVDQFLSVAIFYAITLN